MNEKLNRFMSDKPNLGPEDAYDIAQKAGSSLEVRQNGANLIGDRPDDISLLFHAAQHFHLKILGIEVKGKVKPITARIKRRKAKVWKTYIKNRPMVEMRNFPEFLLNNKPTKTARKKAKAQSAMGKLDQLIGLNEVKEQIQDIGHLMKNRKDRERKGLPAIAISQHLVFTGNPGTGKTTVARLVGEIFRELGVLEKGQFIEIDGRGLIGDYIGQTATKTKEIVSTALGGVLFIDEAYALAQSDSANDFGAEAVATLIKLMEDNRDRLVVIVAGYEDEMEKLIYSNPGLKSRFKTKIDFPDYSETEIFDIFRKLCSDHLFALTKQSAEKAKLLFTEMHRNKGEQFGNGRSVRNMFDRCILNHSRRFGAKRRPSRKELQILYQADIPELKDVEW